MLLFCNKFSAFLALSIGSFFLLTSCSPPSPKIEERVERYETGEVSRRIQLVNGKKEGQMTDFYPNGKVMAERVFSAGKQVGKTTIYYPSGNLKEVQYFQDGAQTAGDTLWYENGAIQFAVTFKKNQKDGYLRKWAPDGALIFEAKYAEDVLIEVKGEPILQDSNQAQNPVNRNLRPAVQ